MRWDEMRWLPRKWGRKRTILTWELKQVLVGPGSQSSSGSSPCCKRFYHRGTSSLIYFLFLMGYRWLNTWSSVKFLVCMTVRIVILFGCLKLSEATCPCYSIIVHITSSGLDFSNWHHPAFQLERSKVASPSYYLTERVYICRHDCLAKRKPQCLGLPQVLLRLRILVPSSVQKLAFYSPLNQKCIRSTSVSSSI